MQRHLRKSVYAERNHSILKEWRNSPKFEEGSFIGDAFERELALRYKLSPLTIRRIIYRQSDLEHVMEIMSR
jgi:Mor family transcriptional regulator